MVPWLDVRRRRGEAPASDAGGQDPIDVTFSDNNPGSPSKRVPPRDTWAATRRGLRGRCPSCGRGRILYAYAKVKETCPACGEEMHHHRADDFPPYITIFVVGYLLGAAMLVVDDAWPALPVAVHLVIWPALCGVLSVRLLPIFKGGLVAYQWALRMHGFETAHRQPTGAAPPQAAQVVARADPAVHRSAA